MASNHVFPRAERGQILVVFVLAMVGIIGMVGLAIDGGGAYAQRRDQQTAADLAALAGANDYLLSNNATEATSRARAIAATNDFSNAGPTVVDVAIDTSNGVELQVTIQSPHRNSFLGALGMGSWDVTTSATALSGFPDTAAGAGPFIFSIGAFNDDGSPKYQTATDFGETNGDVPTSELDLAWTNYGTGNVNTTEVSEIIKGAEVVTESLSYGEYIGQQNNGNHNSLYSDVDTYLSGLEMPVADRRRGRQLHGLGDVPREQRVRRLEQAHQRVLPELLRERPDDGDVLREQRLPALSGHVRPEADQLRLPCIRTPSRRCRLRSALTHPRVRSLAVLPGALR